MGRAGDRVVTKLARQLAKAAAITDLLAANDVTADIAEALTDHDTPALLAGVNPPSAETWLLVVNNLRQRETALADVQVTS